MKKLTVLNHVNKRIVAIFLAVVMMVCAIPTIGLTASAASTTAFDILSSSKYARTYALSPNGRTIPYTSSNLSTRGTASYGANKNSYIDNNSDEIRILDVGRNNKGDYWALVSYPSGSKRVNAYIYLSTLTPNNGSHAKSVSSGKFSCAPRRDASLSGSYYVSKGDTVYLVASHGSRYQILYPSGSVWRLAWCNSSDYNKYCTSAPKNNSSSMVDVTRSFDGKKITLRSVENGKYLCADGNLSNTPAACNRDTASTASDSWEHFTVTCTSDGWAGFKAYNGKWLSARMDVTNNPVRANADHLQSWECFRIYQKGNDYYIKAQINSKWLCVRVDMNDAPVQAYVYDASTWERFSINVVDSSSNNFSPVWPCATAYNVTCMYYYKSGSKHSTSYGYKNGMDISGGGNIVAVEKGTVEKVINLGNKSFGKYIVILHDNGVRSLYAHLSSFNVSTGQRVSRGQVIGKMGNTGNSDGTHLHFEMSNCDPFMTYYKNAYRSSIRFELNVRSNNSKFNSDKSIVNWIDSNYRKSGGWYVAK